VADTTVRFEFDLPDTGRASRDASREHETALVVELRSGVESAYERLIAQFEQPVFNIVSRLMDDPADAADVVQEVFLKVFRNIAFFRQDASLKTWIFRISVNEARNHRRWFSRHRRREVGLESEPANGGTENSRALEDRLADPGRSPYEAMLDRETRELIEDALSTVNPTFRETLILREMEGLSYEEIGDILNISLGTVKSRILRGRDALRKNLAERLEPNTAPGWYPQLAD